MIKELVAYGNPFFEGSVSIAAAAVLMRIHSVDKSDDPFTRSFRRMLVVLKDFYTDYKIAFCIINLVCCTRSYLLVDFFSDVSNL